MNVLSREHLALMMEAGYILLGMRRFKEAQEVMEGISVMAPDSDIPLVAIGSVDFCRGKFRTAIKHYDQALKVNPASAFAKAYRGEALFFMGKTAEARGMLEVVIREDAGGKAATFAKALLDAVDKGFTPGMLTGVDEVKAVEKAARKG
jgi:tetratricopeptide (TPR) repeat protein